MKVLGRLHETLIRRVDKDNPESDYYELYPISIADNIYMNEDEDESLSEFLANMNFKYNIFLDNLKFPVNGVTVFDGTNFGPVKLGIVKLTAKDFGLDQVDNTSDANKPVNQNHKAYIEGYLNTISDQISSILGNVDNWNRHMLDYNNPHRVTWEQVSGGSPINPNELVDEKYVIDAVDAHNRSTDLSILHPSIVNQITVLQDKVNQLNSIISKLESEAEAMINNITDKAVYDHNADPSSHPSLISRLNQLQLDITAAIDQFSGMSGVEFVSNRVDKLDLRKMNDKWDETYVGKYPSVNALKRLMLDLDFNSYSNVQYLENTTMNDIFKSIDDNLNGIIFADRVDGVDGTHIFVYQRSGIVARYSLPGPAPIVKIDHVTNAPTPSEADAKYGSNNAIILADHSTSSPNNQSIVLWNNYTYYEYVIDTLKIGPNEAIYGADFSNTNTNYDYSKFSTGHGILFVSDLNGTGSSGIVLYNKGENPELRELYYGSSGEEILLKSFPTTPTVAQLETLFKTGTGLVYVENSGTTGNIIYPSLEYWKNFKRVFAKPLVRTVVETHRFTWTGSGNETVTFQNKYSNPPKVICVLEGFDTSSVDPSTRNLQLKVTPSTTTVSSTTVSRTITPGVTATYSVTVIGTPDGLLS